jgi:hypothetical protein
MSESNSLYIPKRVLVNASGIDEKNVNADIKSGALKLNENGNIWYRQATQYVCQKWEQGKTDMYDPNGGEPDHNFSSRILSILDDEIGVSNLSFKWNGRSNQS